MKEKNKENKLIRNFLIETNLLNFSIRELTDAFCNAGNCLGNREKTYQYIYRELCRLEAEGWLVSEGEKRTKIFSVFAKRELIQSHSEGVKSSSSDDWLRQLQFDKSKTETGLAIVLSEVEEYKALMDRFPVVAGKIKPLLIAARGESAELSGKVNALSNVLKLSRAENKNC